MTAPTGQQPSRWPTHLRPGAIRFGRASVHYDETIPFYRDIIGLPVVGEFKDSFGEADGTIFGLPDTSVQIEIIRASDTNGHDDAFNQLVLYLDNTDAVTAATAELRRRGYQPEPAQHPYWEANGAVTYRDPDGRDVVYAPWVYGRDPEPVDSEVRA